MRGTNLFKYAVRQLIADVSPQPGEMPVVLAGGDHSYVNAVTAGAVKAVLSSDGSMYQYYGPEYLQEGDKIIDVFLVGEVG